ncbi:STY4526/YPO1902 family pathogenicity island replication protein, partial [uncultured Vibrio sp.]|uniref:STY4526/YPO1902 family pathogenicity island replication protein n=1 Tax=uncultured Vibrio sp. TaxID=114054 RepID=UPI00261B6257
MSVKKDDLTSEVCHVVITKLAHLAISGQEDALRTIGVNDAQISKLERLSYRELEVWVRERKSALDITPLMQALFSEAEPPEEYKTFLLHGANNKMMMHFFGVRAEECRAFRDKLF